MDSDKKVVVAYDFDGTLINGDSMWMFFKFINSRWRRFCVLARSFPSMLTAYLVPRRRSAAKERLISRMFAPYTRKELRKKGREFADLLDRYADRAMLDKIEENSRTGYEQVIVTASVSIWVEPWAQRHGLEVIATEMECVSGRWLYSTPNCKGREKVRRLMQRFPDREHCYLIAYGDSKIDLDMLGWADEGYLIKRSHTVVRKK